MSWVGVVLGPARGERSPHFGSCFALGGPDVFVTAAHVLASGKQQGVSTFYVSGMGVPPVKVERVEVHPAADLAVLFAPHDLPVTTFEDVGVAMPGERVLVAGIPGVKPDVECTVARLLAGVETPKRHAPGYSYNNTDWLPVGSLPENYKFQAIELADALDFGYCGAPILTEALAVAGVITARARYPSSEQRSLGPALHPLEAWLTGTIERECVR